MLYWGTVLFKGVQCCVGMYSAVQECTVPYRNVQCCTGMYSAV